MASSSSSSPEIRPVEPVRFSYKDASEEEVLDDLSSRFILNLPDEELASLERLCFQVEQAHWFYEDFIREENNNLPSYNLKRFSETLFKACPLLQQWSHDHEQAFSTFMQYKTRVPVCGAIMLNDTMDKCVLVKGWKASSGWGFPKGKINEDEHPRDCAVREVLEETGYNLANQIDGDDYFEMSIKEQKICLYIVPGVPEDFPFKTKTRKEISKIEWFRLADLPTWKKKQAAPGKFYLITPFINPLKKFISQRRSRKATGRNGKQKNPQPVKSDAASRRSDPIPSSQSSNNVAGYTSHLQQPEPPTSQTMESAQMDPQLARLLSSLAKSATVTSDDAAERRETSVVESGPQIANSPPTHQSDVFEESPVVAHSHEQQDWSSSVPSYSQPAEIQQQQPEPSPKRAPIVASPIPSASNQFSSSAVVVDTSRNPKNISIPNPKDTPSSLSSPTSSASPSSRRKSSSTADISPYLSRQAEVPTSAKMLQQLSLLETVADESARMAPIIAARAAMASRGPISGGYPNTSASVPPQAMPVREPNGMYSYYPGPPMPLMPPMPPASAAGFHPRFPVENQMNGYQDPFQVRARTSQAFHRGPVHNHTASVSMSQNHLLAAINGSRAGPISPNYSMGPQFMHQQQAQMFSPGPPPFYGPPSHAHGHFHPVPQPMNGYSNFPNNMPPPPPLPTSIRPHSTANSNPLPSMNTVPPNAQNATSVSLLSILNGRPTQQTTMPGPAHQ